MHGAFVRLIACPTKSFEDTSRAGADNNLAEFTDVKLCVISLFLSSLCTFESSIKR